MSNMTLYEKFRAVPQEAAKKIEAGRLKGKTDINPMWRIKVLTEAFGPCGVGWWYEITDKRLVPDETTHQTAAFVDILLYYNDPETGHASHGIPGTGGSSFVAQERNGAYLSDECFKMALTDAISVAAKALGVGANVYWEKDKTKYTGNNEPTPPPAPPQKPAPKPPAPPKELLFCEDCGAVLRPYTTDDNKKISAQLHAEGSRKRFGRRLCLDCIEKQKVGSNG